MTFRKIVSLVLTMPALIGVLWTTAARAQEEGTVPGAIPDPSTYQGSMEQQRQSDSQDQQFRQQQQEQQPAYQGQSRSGGYGASRSSGSSWASTACYGRIAASRAFAPLAGRMALASADPRAIELFGDPSKPGAAEKSLLQQWLVARRHCQAVWDAEDHSQAQRLAVARWGYPAVVRLTGQLLAGQLTYGQFNYRRALNQVAMTNFLNGAR